MRIAMWSGPRNLSTAMMYSFGAREDFAVIDEPFYVPYLVETGIQHPMREKIIASRTTDVNAIVQDLLDPVPDGKLHFYQKHMCQHMVSGLPRDWISEVTNVFLIRHPARVVASFSAGYEHTTLDDIGFVQQLEIYEILEASGTKPVVIDSADIRRDPEKMLRKLCDAIGLSWDPAMLSWPKGGHPADGVWGDHWYSSVRQSTGFAGPEGDLPILEEEAARIAEAAMPAYEQLKKSAIK
ncbi:MAG: HAD family hydrolase [Pseudomonadota bacterium]